MTDAEACGQSIYALAPAETADAWRASHQWVIAERASVEFEEEIMRPCGARTYTSLKTPLFDASGKPTGVVSISTDITERKQAEDERAELLRREHEARLAAEAAIQIRDDFLSVAAHELKTPVTSLRAAAQIISRKLWKSETHTPQWLSDGLRVIDQQSERLARLIGQLFDVSRLDLDMQLGECVATDLTALAERLVATFGARTTRHTLMLMGDESVVATVDPIGIEQVVSNLLDNAIKYSPNGGEIDIEACLADGEHARLIVRDHGIGIPPEKRGEIFVRFYQGHAEDHRSGLGLGLFISQQIVALHGGEIRVEFPADGGARFIVSLPVNANALVPIG